ncbi:MAG: glycosyltransferase, partial [Terriglobales bacterium]
MRVSVLVSTCNRCDKLRVFLDTMKANGSAYPMETEVVVIDNNSSDATKQVVAEYTSLANPAFRYLLERKPGKSCALNAGIREAKGEIIAFTDDDCVPSRSWVARIVKEFESDSELAVLGGRVELYDETDLPQAILLSNYRTLVT